MPALLVPLATGLLVFALVELLVLLMLGHWLGAGWVLLWVLIAAAAGIKMITRFGPRSWRGVRADVHEARLPGPTALDDMLLTLSGLLLLLPGIVSDVLALVLLLPGVRPVVRKLAGVVLFKRFGLLGLLLPIFGAGRGRAVVQTTTVQTPSQPHQVSESPVIEGTMVPKKLRRLFPR